MIQGVSMTGKVRKLFTRGKPNCQINFMLLEMEGEQLGKPNQLYIKMNSRGEKINGL